MIDWWLNLNIYEHIVLTLAVASTIVVLAKIIFDIFKFYSVDKLNSEPEDLEKYEKIANNDSDIEKHVPRFITVISLNIFIISTSWSYFIFILFTSKALAIFFSILIGIASIVIYSIVKLLIKKRKNKV